MATAAPASVRPAPAPPAGNDGARADAASTAAGPFLWTRERYDRAVEAGVLGPDDKVELIEGELVYRMSQNPPHEVATGLISDVLRAVFGTGAHTRDEKSIALSDLSKPEPDVAVVRGRRRDYLDGSPTPADVLLVVEVAESSLASDRERKARIYAEAGILEYWIVNLAERVVEVHRDPAGGTYRTKTTHGLGDSITPVNAPGTAIAVADLLP